MSTWLKTGDNEAINLDYVKSVSTWEGIPRPSPEGAQPYTYFLYGQTGFGDATGSVVLFSSPDKKVFDGVCESVFRILGVQALPGAALSADAPEDSTLVFDPIPSADTMRDVTVPGLWRFKSERDHKRGAWTVTATGRGITEDEALACARVPLEKTLTARDGLPLPATPYAIRRHQEQIADNQTDMALRFIQRCLVLGHEMGTRVEVALPFLITPLAVARTAQVLQEHGWSVEFTTNLPVIEFVMWDAADGSAEKNSPVEFSGKAAAASFGDFWL